MNILTGIRNTALMAAMATLMALAFLALWPDMAKAAPGWRLQVRQAAVTSGERVRLSEVVRVVGDAPAEIKARLTEAVLWKGPSYSGRQQAVSRKQLEKLMEYYVPKLAPACVYPSRLVVQRGGVVFDRQAIEQKIVEFLTPQLARPGGEVNLRDFRVPNYIFLPDEMSSVEIIASSLVRPGPLSVVVQAKGMDGHISHRAAASLFADVWMTVPCAAKPINRFDEVTPEKVTFIRKNLAYVSNPWDGKSGSFRMTRPVGTGQPLLTDAMEAIPMITKGERVSLVYQGRTIRLAIKAEALSDAEFGDLVEVRNLQSKRTVLATVQDTSTVVVR